MNKPVAWIRDGDSQLSLVREKDDGYLVWKPLYLSQSKELKLTNDEIREIGEECLLKNNGILNWIQFAKAILRKAQEK